MIPIGLGLAAALLFFGPLVSWIASASTLLLLLFDDGAMNIFLKSSNKMGETK
jgi:hypothetical protein